MRAGFPLFAGAGERIGFASWSPAMPKARAADAPRPPLGRCQVARCSARGRARTGSSASVRAAPWFPQVSRQGCAGARSRGNGTRACAERRPSKKYRTTNLSERLTVTGCHESSQRTPRRRAGGTRGTRAAHIGRCIRWKAPGLLGIWATGCDKWHKAGQIWGGGASRAGAKGMPRAGASSREGPWGGQ